MCETVWFFSWVNTNTFHPKFITFRPKFSGDSYVEFQGKTILGEFFRNFRVNQVYPLPKLVKFRPTFCNFYSASVLCWKNTHKKFHMLFATKKGCTSINEPQKEDTGKKSQDVLFSENQFCSLSVWDLVPLTPWVFWSEILTRRSSLCLLSFG